MTVRLQYPPPAWSRERLAAFERLMDAVEVTALYTLLLQQVGITSGPAIDRRAELRVYITDVLLPEFLAT